MAHQCYRPDPWRADFQHDPAQQEAIRHLDRIRQELMSLPQTRPTGIASLLRLVHRGTPSPVKGLYLWGGVGRGKTYLLDAFHAALPSEQKLRLHFHRFMQRVHRELRTLKNQPDPVKIVSRRLGASARIICLDEFLVADITDAVLLHRLLAGLFSEGITLVTTSNIPPDDLYRHGLQRALFLPAIDLLKKHLDVFELDAGTDYRLRTLERAEVYHSPADQTSETRLSAAFLELAPTESLEGGHVEIEGRLIPVQRIADDVVWFRFRDICDGPRSQIDFVEISKQFHTVLISGIPVMDATMDNQARRFMALIDEFYDRRVKLILSAHASPEDLYAGTRLEAGFQRTISRLHEMQSKAYLATPHLP